MNKNLLFTLIVLLVLVLGGVAVYYILNQRATTSTTSSTETISPQASPTITSGSTDAEIQKDLDNTNVTENDSDLKEIKNDIESL